VLIESDPSAARVELDGQLLGLTPLSTQLPLGSVALDLSRDGYEPREARLDVQAGEAGETVLRRFSLTRAKSVRSEQASPRRKKPRAAPRHRPAPPPPPRAVRPQATAPTREVEPEPPKPRVDPEPARLIEPERRARLLDERRPARLLD
jgi:hypothetical protein